MEKVVLEQKPEVRNEAMKISKGSSFLAQEALRATARGISEKARKSQCQEQSELERLVGNGVRG